MLEIKDIHISFPDHGGLLRKARKNVLNGVSLNINQGECVGIIGESGSGKSTLGKVILGIEKPDKGSIIFENSTKRKLWRHEMNVVFQDYTTSVNPRFKVFDIIAESFLNTNIKKKDLKYHIVDLLIQVGLDESYLDRYPHQLSGGQLQRVCIARAIALKPKFILLDEAISSLDVSVQVQILDLLIELKEKYKLSYLFITHDLTAVTYICDKVVFFQNGTIVEEIDDINELKHIKHDYSKMLLGSVLDVELPCSC